MIKHMPEDEIKAFWELIEIGFKSNLRNPMGAKKSINN